MSKKKFDHMAFQKGGDGSTTDIVGSKKYLIMSKIL